MRRLAAWALALTVLAGAAFIGSPYLAVWRLSQAVKGGDARTVAQLTDVAAVRADLKPQLEAWLRARAARRAPHGLLGRLEAALAPYLAGGVVEAAVTPETLTAMLRTARPPRPAEGGDARPATPRGPTDTHAVRLGYVDGDLDQFSAEIASRRRPDRRVGLRLLRRGVLTWRVVSVELPASALHP